MLDVNTLLSTSLNCKKYLIFQILKFRYRCTKIFQIIVSRIKFSFQLANQFQCTNYVDKLVILESCVTRWFVSSVIFRNLSSINDGAFCENNGCLNIVCTPFLLGISTFFYQIFKREGGRLTGSQFLEGFAGKEDLTFFRGCSFYIKDKLKSAMFNDKKVYKQRCFLCHN